MEITQPILFVFIALVVGFVLWGEDLPGVIWGFIKFMLKLIIGLAIVVIIAYIAITILFPQYGLGGLI